MEAHPPSYETATLVDVWDIVAHYLPSTDLCSAALVCSRWHATFAPHIWGNPASHFGIENDAVYVALTHFKRTLQTARLLVRSLTHTLHLPPAHAEIYNGPQADWLRDILERLPSLQSLIVRGLPFFDYAALQALNVVRIRPDQSDHIPENVIELPGSSGSVFQRPTPAIPAFNLRLLDASRCPNITSGSLVSALKRFDGLLYLDLSFSYPARHNDVLSTLKRFAGLQVLKLRGLSLKDESIDVLGKSVGLRVRSLDVRENNLTDRSVRTLLEDCFLQEESGDSACPLPFGQRSPMLLPYIGSEMLDIYQGEDFEGFLRNAFTGRFVSRLAIEDVAHSGITHLYLDGNPITVEGISGLINSKRLHVLDVGSIPQIRAPHPATSTSANYQMVMPGMEKLTPLLAKHGSETMSFLRIDHSLLTKDAPDLHPHEVVQGRVELGDTSLPYNTNHVSELDGSQVRPDAFEMSATPQTPKYELAGDPMRLFVSPAQDHTFHVEDPSDRPNQARRGSALAPEVVESLARVVENRALLSPVSAVDEGTLTNGWRGAVSPIEPSASGSSTPPAYQLRPRSYSSMAVERKARLNAHSLAGGSLHPAMLPHLTTLVLTNVPPYSPDSQVADRIILFIKQCAEEATLASKQASLDYSAPPGRKGHVSALRSSANKIFALKRLVLEMAPEQTGRPNSKGNPWIHPSTRSVTEDRDSEALWSASETDFSFFGDEECVFPTLDTGRFAFYSGTNEKEVALTSDVRHAKQSKAPIKPRIDNIALISAFRKERKAAHSRQQSSGNLEAETDGLWGGIVQVVRSNATMRSDEQEDYYGNKFTNDGLYR